jgi:hypothetical protein
MTVLQACNLGNMVRSLEEKRDISFLQNAQTGSGLHLSPYLSDVGDFCGGKATGGMNKSLTAIYCQG